MSDVIRIEQLMRSLHERDPKWWLCSDPGEKGWWCVGCQQDTNRFNGEVSHTQECEVPDLVKLLGGNSDL